MTTMASFQEKFAIKLDTNSRVMCNYKKEGMPACNCCNPIMPCSSSSGICEDCFQWLKNPSE